MSLTIIECQSGKRDDPAQSRCLTAVVDDEWASTAVRIGQAGKPGEAGRRSTRRYLNHVLSAPGAVGEPCPTSFRSRYGVASDTGPGFDAKNAGVLYDK